MHQKDYNFSRIHSTVTQNSNKINKYSSKLHSRDFCFDNLITYIT